MGKVGDRLRARTVDYSRNLDEVIRRSALEVGRRIIDRTPIKTGKARSNWNISLGAPDITTRDATAEHYLHGAEDLPQPGVGKLSVYDEIPVMISNSLPYAPKLERGSSTQSPSGMVRITAMEFPTIVNAIARRVFGTRNIVSGGFDD